MFQDNEHQPAAQEQQRQPQPGAQPDKAENRGGFNCEFVEQPSKEFQFECPVCLLIICDPYQVTCCGYRFCHSCIERIKADNKPCPTCNNEKISDFPDTGLKRTLYAFKVRCSHQKDGCEWTGELGQLDIHLNLDPPPEKQLDECQFTEINCLYCEEKKQRQYIQGHQNEHCMKRPISCEYCHDYDSNFDDVINNHWPVCGFHPVRCPNECGSFPQRQNLDSHVSDECPLTTISCDFVHVGCVVKLPRKDMSEHLRENFIAHTSLLAVSHTKQIQTLKEENTQLRRELTALSQEVKTKVSVEVVPRTSIPLGPPVLTMTGFQQHKKDGDSWYSPPVYTHHHGYKICLRVVANGQSAAKGTHVSVVVHFMRGEFDDSLKWPVRGFISFQLLDQVKGKDHITHLNIYDDTVADHHCCRVTERERATVGRGPPKLIAHTELEPKYLRNDTLLFQIYNFELNN